MIASVSFDFMVSFSFSMAAVTGAFSASVTLSPSSVSVFSLWKIRLSAWFFASTASFCFLSSAANFSASLTARSMSSLDMLVDEVIVMCCSLPVPLSVAVTFTIPLESISNVTSICGMPRGAGVMPSRMNLPSVVLPAAISRSPWSTWISTEVWLSAAVE